MQELLRSNGANSPTKIMTSALASFVLFSFLCGIVYTGVVTGLSQLLFPDQANGSIITVDGKKYAPLMGQQYTDAGHLWGRIINVDVSSARKADGTVLMYAVPSNLSPASDAYKALVAERVKNLQAANPDMADTAIPVDLVTCSGSGLDPDISPAAAEYQVARIAKARGMTEDAVREIIRDCTKDRFLGLLGEKTVNVLKVNLMLDGILTQ